MGLAFGQGLGGLGPGYQGLGLGFGIGNRRQVRWERENGEGTHTAYPIPIPIPLTSPRCLLQSAMVALHTCCASGCPESGIAGEEEFTGCGTWRQALLQYTYPVAAEG